MNTDKIFMAIEDLDDTLELLDELFYSPINQLKERVRIIKNAIDRATTEIEKEVNKYVNTKILNEFYDLEEDPIQKYFGMQDNYILDIIKNLNEIEEITKGELDDDK